MKNTLIEGQLEVDHDRGVIYFHCSDEKQAGEFGVTPLRICGLPKPIPKAQLDVTLAEDKAAGMRTWFVSPCS